MVGTAQGRLLPTLQSRFQTASFADTASRSRRRFARGLILNFPPSHNRGRRECRAPDAPAVLRAKVKSSTHASHHGHTGITRHSPRNGLRLIPRSPRGPGSFAPVTSAGIASCENLAPASGRQDHTTSPSASSAFVLCAISVHRNPPHVRDDRETPLLVRRDDLLLFLFLPSRQVNFWNSEIGGAPSESTIA